MSRPDKRPPSTAPAQRARGGPAPVFAALGDPTRLSLVQRLSDGERRSISHLSIDTQLTRQAVTKHLKVLEDAGLVESVRSGRESRFSLRVETMRDASLYLDDVSAQWDAALTRLARFIEHKP